jgi:hypothetical protein
MATESQRHRDKKAKDSPQRRCTELAEVTQRITEDKKKKLKKGILKI